MADTDYRGRRFEIGGVISRAFGTIGSNFLLFCGLSLILAGIPGLALEYWQFSIRADLPADSFVLGAGSSILMFLVASLVAIVTGAVLQAALTRATVTSLSGETPEFGECLRIGFRLLLPMVALGLISGIGICIGLAFLIVPGIVLWLIWSVITPAYVQERIGIFRAFGRSAELTKGARGQIFLTGLIVLLLIAILRIPLGFVTAAIAMTGNLVLVAIVGVAINALITMVAVAMQASIYVELRQLKEGIAPAELEAIFA